MISRTTVDIAVGVPGGPESGLLRLATLCLSLYPDEPCGDAAIAVADASAPGNLLLLLADGLGHGPHAAGAARRAGAFVAGAAAKPLPELLHGLESDLQGTRGAAIGVARIQTGAYGLAVTFAGVGNTRALRWRAGDLHRLPSQYGIVGGGFSALVAEHTLPLVPGDWFLMFSDGIQERINLPSALPEWQRDPALLCAHLAQHWRQGADDIGVLACHVPHATTGMSEHFQ